MKKQLLIAGGGIGGLGAALAAGRAGWEVRLLERAPAFSDVGAGIQLGPNAVRVLQGWGLTDMLMACSARPGYLRVRSAESGACLAALELGESIASRYGAPYLTLHRADLHEVLLSATRRQGQAVLSTGHALKDLEQSASRVTVRTDEGAEMTANALVGADGLWSRVRQLLLGDGPPLATGHLAYRALVQQSMLPEKLRTQDVTVWLGPRMHVVHYPVRGGEQLNLVAIVHGRITGDPQQWDCAASADDLLEAMQGSSADLRSIVEAAGRWRLWVLHDRPPMSGAHQHALGRVALVGDAAHPMRPYLAQGAGMALEDADQLARALGPGSDQALDIPARLQSYAQHRWQRNARVQARARRNGEVFHSQGLFRLGRDASLRLLGGRLLDLPWLYGGGAPVAFG